MSCLQLPSLTSGHKHFPPRLCLYAIGEFRSHRSSFCFGFGQASVTTARQEKSQSALFTRFFHFPIIARSRGSVGAAVVGGFGLTTRSLCQRGRGAEIQRDCTSDGAEWEEEMGALSLCLSQVSAAKFSRMGGTLDCAIALGTCLLPATARSWQGAPCRGASLSFQIDSHRVSLLARPYGL